MINCPNCGTENPDGSRFCGECGADLRAVGAAAPTFPSQQPPSFPPQYAPGQQPGQPFTWSSSEQPLEPEKKKRRIWLWIVVGVLAVCILLCCGFTIFASTDRGQEFIDDLGTRVTDIQTETADTPTP